MMLIPGPVEVPKSVLRESAYVQNHRSDEFRTIVKLCQEYLNRFADSSASVMTTGSGTTAVESLVYSMTRRREKVLAVSFGEFGNRMIDSLGRRGCDLTVLQKDPSQSLEAGEITDLIFSNKGIETVFLVHNETGNGTSIRNLMSVVEECKGLGRKVLVDSVSGFGGMEIKANSWGIDAFATCSQKGLASVPGLGIVCISDEGRKKITANADAPIYLDLNVSLKFLKKNETPFTPSTGSFRALLAALMILENEGIENRWKRHSVTASFVRTYLQRTGSMVYGIERNYSDTVMAFKPPVPVRNMVSEMMARGIQVSKGMGSLADSMIRIGLLGLVGAEITTQFLNAYFESIGAEERVQMEHIPEGTKIKPEITEVDVQSVLN